MNDGLFKKLDWLLRYHRQHVFDVDGDTHMRALRRLKKTATFAAMLERQQVHADYLASERLLRRYA